MSNVFDSKNKVTGNGFIDKNEILKYVSEEDIYKLVFGFKPEEFDYVVSPFREDRRPGCWFQYSYSGKLSFVDFGSKIYKRGVQMIRIDCFDAVQEHFNLPNLYHTLLFIKKHLIDGKDLPEREIVLKKYTKEDVPQIQINFIPREFSLDDKKFWYKRYGISKENLIEDKVFPISQYKVINSRQGDYTVNTDNLTYCYADFENGKKKIYRPYQTGKRRFLSTCTQNDVGGIRHLPESAKKLIITKSYKDYRVLKNQGLNVVWFQNEGMYPKLDILLPLCKRFEFITIIFDNDKTGIEAANKIVGIINSYFPGKSSYIHLPIQLLAEGIKDPSDFIEVKGRRQLINFLLKNKLL